MMLIIINHKYTYECDFPVEVGDKVKLPKGDKWWIGKVTDLESNYTGSVKKVLCFADEEPPVSKLKIHGYRSLDDPWEPSMKE